MLFAANNLFLDSDFLVTVGLLIATLLAAAIVFSLADRWKKRQMLAEQYEPADSLTSFREMFERGELTRSEYEVIRNKTAAKIKALPPAGTTVAKADDANSSADADLADEANSDTGNDPPGDPEKPT